VLAIIFGLCCSQSDRRNDERRRLPSRDREDDPFRFPGGFGERYPGDFGSYGGREEFDVSGINTYGSRRKPCERTSSDEYCKEIPKNREDEAQINWDNVGNELTEFAWNLFKNSNNRPNFVISGLSPQLLLSYLNWGAEGDTRRQMTLAKIPGAPRNYNRLVKKLTRGNNEKRELKFATAFFHDKNMK
jgi:hypothetical protein